MLELITKGDTSSVIADHKGDTVGAQCLQVLEIQDSSHPLGVSLSLTH